MVVKKVWLLLPLSVWIPGSQVFHVPSLNFKNADYPFFFLAKEKIAGGMMIWKTEKLGSRIQGQELLQIGRPFTRGNRKEDGEWLSKCGKVGKGGNGSAWKFFHCLFSQ